MIVLTTLFIAARFNPLRVRNEVDGAMLAKTTLGVAESTMCLENISLWLIADR